MASNRAEGFLARATELKSETAMVRNAASGTLTAQMADNVAVSDEFIVLPHHGAPGRTITVDATFSVDISTEAPASTPNLAVPSWSEHILTWVTDNERRLAVLGDLEERFHKRAKQRGEAEATRWYREHAAVAAAHFVFQTAARLTGIAVVLRKLGLL